MKGRAYGQYRHRSYGISWQGGIRKKRFETENRLNNMPYVVLWNLASFLYGFDALAFGEIVSFAVMASERQFWRSLGVARMERQGIALPLPRNNYYMISTSYFAQVSSGRVYRRFVYNGFLAERLLFLMNCCNSDSFRTYVRLQSYSSYQICYSLPILSFFEYAFMSANRDLNRIEMRFFRICRDGHLGQRSITVDNIEAFETNLNIRFGFCHIKKLINFSLFVMAGGAVLNGLLIDGFDSSEQDLDFFWLGGSWILFLNAIQRFKRKVYLQILEETNKHGKIIEFILLIENNRKIRIQFIFGRIDANIPFVLYTFDLDIVQVAYDGERIISTIGFFQAIATKSFICYTLTNNILDSPLYVDRCLKYHARGFTWICPIPYNQVLAQKPLISAKNTIDYGFNEFYYNVDSFNIQIRFLMFNLFQ